MISSGAVARRHRDEDIRLSGILDGCFQRFRAGCIIRPQAEVDSGNIHLRSIVDSRQNCIIRQIAVPILNTHKDQLCFRRHACKIVSILAALVVFPYRDPGNVTAVYDFRYIAVNIFTSICIIKGKWNFFASVNIIDSNLHLTNIQIRT